MVKKNSQHKNPFSLFTYIRFELIYIYFLLDRRPRGFRCGIARAAPRPLPRAFPRPLPLPRAPRPRPRPRPLFGGVAAFFFFPATIFASFNCNIYCFDITALQLNHTKSHSLSIFQPSTADNIAIINFCITIAIIAYNQSRALSASFYCASLRTRRSITSHLLFWRSCLLFRWSSCLLLWRRLFHWCSFWRFLLWRCCFLLWRFLLCGRCTLSRRNLDSFQHSPM